MPNQIYALVLIILSALPGFSFKSNLENRVTTALLGSPKTHQEVSKTNFPTIPFKVDPLAQALTTAQAAYFIDLDSGEVLLAKNETKKLPVASTTKLMTAIVAQEKLDPNGVVSVTSLGTQPLDAVMGLTIGDKIKVSELMHGLLIPSGADAAVALAIAASGSEARFVAEMNQKAANFGLSNTEFSNPIGHDDPNNLSTAKDIAALSRLALSNKTIASIVAKKTYTAESESGKKYYLENTNYLLSDPNYKGVKTGTTYEAGQCLVLLYNDGERKILGVVLNSPNRFGETRQIIEWTKQAFSW